MNETTIFISPNEQANSLEEAFEEAKLDGAPDEERDIDDVDFSTLTEDQLNYVSKENWVQKPIEEQRDEVERETAAFARKLEKQEEKAEQDAIWGRSDPLSDRDAAIADRQIGRELQSGWNNPDALGDQYPKGGPNSAYEAAKQRARARGEYPASQGPQMSESEAKAWGEAEHARWQERGQLIAEHEQQRSYERQIYEQQLQAAQWQAMSEQERQIQQFCQYRPEEYLQAAQSYASQAQEAAEEWDEERARELAAIAQRAYDIGEVVAQRYQAAENQQYFLQSAARLAQEHPELQDPNNWKCQRLGEILDTFPELQQRPDGIEIAYRALQLFKKGKSKGE